MTRRQLIAARILLILYLVAILFLCFGKFEGTDDVPMDLWGIPTDKIVHFLMFLPFPLLAFFAFDRFTESIRPSVLWVLGTFAAGALLASGTEWVQGFLPYRTRDFADLKADLLALGASSLLVLFLDLRKQKK